MCGYGEYFLQLRAEKTEQERHTHVSVLFLELNLSTWECKSVIFDHNRPINQVACLQDWSVSTALRKTMKVASNVLLEAKKAYLKWTDHANSDIILPFWGESVMWEKDSSTLNISFQSFWNFKKKKCNLLSAKEEQHRCKLSTCIPNFWKVNWFSWKTSTEKVHIKFCLLSSSDSGQLHCLIASAPRKQFVPFQPILTYPSSEVLILPVFGGLYVPLKTIIIIINIVLFHHYVFTE